jgi:hypothetical protein
MKLQEKWALGAGSAFTLSFFLPALDSNSGYSCLVDCWRVLIRSEESSVGGWIYYSGFVASNALFVALWAALFCSVRHIRARLWTSILASLHVLSWFVLNLAQGEQLSLGIGYYVWLLSFLLLVTAHVCVRNGLHPSPHPADQSPKRE